MSSFQFPANPSDGDIVVRGNLQAFYNAATNTWRVSEVPTAPGIPGPPGPPGPIGPEGKGVEISGAVDTFADLPAPNAHQFEFWIVDDTNTLYNSDGITWRDLGGPIQGPQGEHGEDGADGTNGQNGRGWYDTNIIDERPNNYQVQFLSNDGLGFTTDNIMGPQGETGSLQVATETTLGGIKIGRGLDIAPDGTATAGVTTVNLETTPVSEAGLAVTYAPIFIDMGEFKRESALGERNDYVWMNDSATVQMPSAADGAFMFYFSSTSVRPSIEDPNNPPGVWRAFRAYIKNTVTLTNAIYLAGRSSIMGHVHNHNLSIPQGLGTIANRLSTLPITKINELEFATGAEVTFNFEQELYRAGGTDVTGGTCRIVIFPFRRGDTITTQVEPYQGIVDEGGFLFYDPNDIDQIIQDYFPPITPEEENRDYGEQFRSFIYEETSRINSNLDYVNDAEKAQLITYRDQLHDARNLPGTPEEIYAYLLPISNGINAILDYKFRFE